MRRTVFCWALALMLCMAALMLAGEAEGIALSGEALDPCAPIRFTSGGAALLQLSAGPEDCCTFGEDGLFLSGKYGSWSGVSFSLPGSWSFGDADSAPVRRVRIDGLARQGTNVVVSLFLDDEDKPFAVKQLNAQSEEKNWQEEKPVFAEIEEPLRGEHAIRFTVQDMSSPARKKSEALIRGIRFYRETLPTVYVHIDESLGSIEAMNADPDHHTQCYGSMEVRVPEGYVCEYAQEGQEDYKGGQYALEYIRGRGESTWAEAKKPYKIKLESKADLFGMGANKHWALLADFFDRSFMRNRLTYRLGEALGLEYTPRLVPVELVINGDFQGLYYLSETVRVDDSRVAIDDLENYTAEDGDISGGYLLSKRRPWDEEGYLFETARSGPMAVVSPEKLDEPQADEDALQEMFAYIVGYFRNAEDAVFGLNGLNADGVHYTEYLDLDAMARVYLIQEFCMNRDAYRTDSSFLYKPRGGKLYWGPLWDFDLDAWGGDSVETYLADDRQAAQAAEGIYQQNAWFRVLRGDPVFVDAVRSAWGGPNCDDPATLRFQLAELIRDGGVLDRYEAELACAAQANADLPGYAFDYLAEADWLEGPLIETDFHGEVFRLRRWIADRMRWFDENIENLLDEDARVELTFVSDGETLEVRSVINDEPVFGFPMPEGQEGRLFAGWYADAPDWDEETGEEFISLQRVMEGSDFCEDTVLTARWVDAEAVILPEAIFLERSEAYVRSGAYIPIGCTVMPEGADDTVFYSSSDPDCAFVDKYGMLTVGAQSGDVTITATTINGRSDEILLHIASPGAEDGDWSCNGEEIGEAIWSFWVDETEITMRPGEYRRVEIAFDPENALKPDFRILNAFEEIACMTPEGVLAARSEGTAVIFIVHDQKDEAVRLTVTVTQTP